MKKYLRMLALLAALMLVLAACGGDDDDDTSGSGSGSGSEPAAEGEGEEGDGEALKVAFVYVGPIGDAGWTKKHDDGRKELEEALGDQVETTYLENIPEGAESVATFEDLGREGYDLVFATSFGYGDPIQEVAPNFPDTVFMHATGYMVGDNIGTYFGAAEEARYLSGIAAGEATQNGKIGYVAAFPIPEVLRGINAFTLGVRSVNPEATVQVVWTSTWFGPDTEKQAAQSLTEAGVDVLAMHQDSPATGEAATEASAKWVGYNDDLSRFAPEAWLTGPVWDWGPFYIKTAEQVMDGSWVSEQYYGNMADGLVGLAPFGDSVPSEVQDEIAAKQAEIVDGTFAPFTGPINNQAGEEVLADGQVATLEELLSMDYFVEGVVGDIPSS